MDLYKIKDSVGMVYYVEAESLYHASDIVEAKYDVEIVFVKKLPSYYRMLKNKQLSMENDIKMISVVY